MKFKFFFGLTVLAAAFFSVLGQNPMMNEFNRRLAGNLLRQYCQGDIKYYEKETYNNSDLAPSIWCFHQYSITDIDTDGFTIVLGNKCGTEESGCSERDTYRIVFSQISRVQESEREYGNTWSVQLIGNFTYTSSEDRKQYQAGMVGIHFATREYMYSHLSQLLNFFQHYLDTR